MTPPVLPLLLVTTETPWYLVEQFLHQIQQTLQYNHITCHHHWMNSGTNFTLTQQLICSPANRVNKLTGGLLVSIVTWRQNS